MKTLIKIALIFVASSVLAETTRFDRIKETNQVYTASQADATFATKADLATAAELPVKNMTPTPDSKLVLPPDSAVLEVSWPSNIIFSLSEIPKTNALRRYFIRHTVSGEGMNDDDMPSGWYIDDGQYFMARGEGDMVPSYALTNRLLSYTLDIDCMDRKCMISDVRLDWSADYPRRYLFEPKSKNWFRPVIDITLADIDRERLRVNGGFIGYHPTRSMQVDIWDAQIQKYVQYYYVKRNSDLAEWRIYGGSGTVTNLASIVFPAGGILYFQRGTDPHGIYLEPADLSWAMSAQVKLQTQLEAATTNLNARPISILPDQTFIDLHGDICNGPVEIGEGAIAIADTSEVPTNIPIRSVSVAIGAGADARDLVHPDKQQAIAIGNNARASGVNAIAIGSGVRHIDEDNITGNNAYALGAQAIALGYSAKSVTNNAVQIGTGTNNTPHSLQFEDTVIVRGGKVVTDGMDTNAVRALIQAESDKGLMYGSTGSTNGFVYIRMAGYNSAQDTDPEFVVAISTNENADVAASFPLFPGSPNRREVYSVATVDRLLGESVKTNHVGDVSIHGNVAEQDSVAENFSHAEGHYTNATGLWSHAEGYFSGAFGNYSHSEGSGQALGSYSHAEGNGPHAEGFASHSEGDVTGGPLPNGWPGAYGHGAHSEGVDTLALGYASHSEGQLTQASNDCAHAEGYNTMAIGSVSHAEGDSTMASGQASHAEGKYGTASGKVSHASGFYSSAEHDLSWVWNGINDESRSYSSHGDSTFNVNPTNGAAGFFIGESNLVDIVNALIDARLATQQGN